MIFLVFISVHATICIDILPSRSSPLAVLLHDPCREGRTVRRRFVANLSFSPIEKIAALRRLLKNEPFVGLYDSLDIAPSLPHGHVPAVLGTRRMFVLTTLIDPRPSSRRNQVLAMIVARIIEFASKLPTSRRLAKATAASTPGGILECGLDEHDIRTAMDWFLECQASLEAHRDCTGPVTAATRSETRRLEGRKKIDERVGKVIGAHKMTKHITWSIDDDGVVTCLRSFQDRRTATLPDWS